MKNARVACFSRRDILSLVAIAALPAVAVRAQSAKPKIAFLLKTMQEQRYEIDKRVFIATAEKLGAEVVFRAASNNEETQIDQFDDILNQGVDVVVLQPVNTGTAGSLVAKANQKNVRVVGYDSMVTGGPLDAMVMQDSWEVGRLQSEAMLAWLVAKHGKPEGNVALIMGQPGDSNAQALSSEVLKAIAANPGLKLIAQRSHVGWSPEVARETAESLLVKYNNGIDAFICNNSGMAFGIMKALKDEGLDDASKVFVAGADADLGNIRLVAEGKQAIDVWKKLEPLAEKAAEVAVALATNKDKPVSDVVRGFVMRNNGAVDVPTFVTPVVAVTKETIESTLVSAGIYSKDQIYGN